MRISAHYNPIIRSIIAQYIRLFKHFHAKYWDGRKRKPPVSKTGDKGSSPYKIKRIGKDAEPIFTVPILSFHFTLVRGKHLQFELVVIRNGRKDKPRAERP
jgi:dolichyl-phosphate-mannose--protein O-mannosyl transferase